MEPVLHWLTGAVAVEVTVTVVVAGGFSVVVGEPQGVATARIGMKEAARATAKYLANMVKWLAGWFGSRRTGVLIN